MNNHIFPKESELDKWAREIKTLASIREGYLDNCDFESAQSTVLPLKYAISQYLEALKCQ